MKKLLTIFMLFVAMGLVAYAGPVDEQTAKEVGAKYLNASVGRAASAGEMQSVKTYFMDNGDAAFYVFNTTNSYVIVSAQDVATPILGYSDEGTFDVDAIPEQMEWWLQDYAKQIQYGVEERQIDFEKTVKQWNLVKRIGRLEDNRGERITVGPLLVDSDTGDLILWNQSAIYSTQTPQIPNSANHYAAGCVPVSMSQIMRKWKHPAQGIGSHTSDGSHHETIDFGATTYDWANMPVSLNSEILGRTPTSDEITAVGTLLHHAGVSVDCFYKLSGTDAQSDKVPNALVSYFGYSEEAKLDRLTHRADSIAIWKVKLRSCLNHGYPMYYSGIDHGTLGHAFACDGYDDNDRFHINWGYDGNRNGYFAIGALNYGGNANYNACNDAIFNIHPAGYSTYFDISVTANNDAYGTVTTSSTSVIYGGNVTVTATPKSGYCFCYWSLNGVNVSENAEYTFNVKYDRDLVAVFSAPFTITTASANNEQGTVAGDATNVNYGVMHTITATPKNGYIFVNWTKGGDIVSSHNPYTFKVVGDGDYVANFEELEGVAIGTGDATYNYLPTYSYYQYSYSQQIITANEINKRGELESIALFNTVSSNSRSWNIYLKLTDKTTFTNNTDWIAVTEDDLYYSGTVALSDNEWTYIKLDKKFSYDGLLNLAIIIDDNTNSTSGNRITCKSYSVSGNHAIYKYAGSGANIDPYNVTDVTGTCTTYRNRFILDIIPDASTTYSVTATVEPAGTGFVEGAGDFIFGELCTLTAEPNEQYAFKNWTRNGDQVSTDATYSFNVKEAHDLVANFYSVKPIQFMDSEVETICVEHWDTNGDGCLSNAEAAAVTDLGTYFSANTTITAFDELSYFTGLTTIPNNAFKNCTNLTRVVIPENVTTIGTSAFQGCSALSGTLSLPAELITIGQDAFHGCSSLTGSLVIPDKVTTIGTDAFNGCTGFDGTLTIGKKVSVINGRAFCNCSSFTGDLVIPNSVTSIYGAAFNNCSGFDGMLVLGESVSSISYQAFDGCSGICAVVSKRATPPSVTSANTFNKMSFSIPVYVPNGTSSTYSSNTPGWSQFTNYQDQIKTSSWTAPSATDVISVDNTYELTTNVTARYIYFTADDKVLTIANGKTLTVTNDIASTDASQLVLNDGAQLVCGNSVCATVKKDIAAATAKTPTNWYAISSTVHDVGQSYESIANVTNLIDGTYDLLYYDEAASMWRNQKSSGNAAGFSVLQNGRGYIYRNASAVTLSYEGQTNNGTVYDYTLSYAAENASLRGFNLIGNPYPHDIYKGEGTAIENTYLEEGFYKLKGDGTWLVSTDNTTTIKANEAVLVQAKSTADGQALAILDKTASGAKSNHDNIMFVVANSEHEDVAYAIFDNGHGLNKIDHYNTEAHKLYISKEGEEFALAMLPDNTQSIDLGFKTKTIGQYTLSVKTEGLFGYIHLIDNMTGADIDMLAEHEYSFFGMPNDDENRFTVRLSYNSGDDETFAYQNGDNIIVRGNGELQIFDLTGRMVMRQHINGVQMCPGASLQTGVYILKLNDKAQKLLIK